MSMTKTTFKRFSDFISDTGATLKSLTKLIVQTGRPTVSRHPEGSKLIIMGNGPSLSQTIADHRELLMQNPTMAVNFAANTEEFFKLKPRYYILADPHFFESDHENVVRLRQNLMRVDWKMTLFIPVKARIGLNGAPSTLKIERYNPIGLEGYGWFERMVYDNGRGMPRPRNVLIPAIMIGILIGYKEIVITGADHSWTSTLSVDSSNRVVSIQPHFYKESASEESRISAVYEKVKLHEIIHSFYVAFKAYHDIERYARYRGVKILNATPGSFIDAFERTSTP